MNLRLERKESTNKSHVIEFIGQFIYSMSSFFSVLPRVIQPSASSCTTRGSVSCRRTSTRRPWTSSRRWKRWVTPSQLQFTGFAGVSPVFWVRVTGLTGTKRYHIIQMAQEGLPALRWLHQGVSLGDGGLIFFFPSPPLTSCRWWAPLASWWSRRWRCTRASTPRRGRTTQQHGTRFSTQVTAVVTSRSSGTFSAGWHIEASLSSLPVKRLTGGNREGGWLEGGCGGRRGVIWTGWLSVFVVYQAHWVNGVVVNQMT